MKKFRLLKDLPDLEAGAIFGQYELDGQCYYQYDTPTREVGYSYPHYVVEGSSWFEEVQEKKWTDTDMQLFLSLYAEKWKAPPGELSVQHCLDEFIKRGL